ncbi:hypothetical protein QFC20_007693 [Naganishia adeliensis]|uniref:Uncharacterized protein n=1 Tax=Naganishia adeliensis TaxID=92952 RepID=A0ACC2UVZ0_9TREE|nr:hypothetical protein QFC20_007693 [Naganishia adeliensis]
MELTTACLYADMDSCSLGKSLDKRRDKPLLSQVPEILDLGESLILRSSSCPLRESDLALNTPVSPNTATFDNDDVLSDIFRLFIDPYSPSKPELVYDGEWVNLEAFDDYPEGEYHSEDSTANNSSVAYDVQAYGHVNSNVVTHQGVAQATANVAAVASSVTFPYASTDVAQDDSQAVINFMTPG